MSEPIGGGKVIGPLKDTTTFRRRPGNYVSPLLSTAEEIDAYEAIDWKKINAWEESLRRGEIDWLKEPTRQKHLDDLSAIRKNVSAMGLSKKQADKLDRINRLDDVHPRARAEAIQKFVIDDKPFPTYRSPTGDRAVGTMPKSRTPAEYKQLDDIFTDAGIRQQAVDHGEALLSPHESKRYGKVRDVPENMMGMDERLNASKGMKTVDDIDSWEYKDNPKTGRTDAYRRVNGELQKVPRWQGGHIDPGLLGVTEANAQRVKNFAKGAGKVGLLGAAEMGLNYLAPENPINQARNQGYEALKDMGFDIEGGIAGIENPMLRGSAHLANGLFADPLVTAFGAGNWLGERVQEELRGEHATNRLKRGKYGMMGRFNQQGLL